MRSLRIWISALAVCLVLAGCTEQPAPYVEPENDAEAIQYWLAEARTLGASEHQIDVLERALERGTALRADVNEMLPDYYDCLDATGLEYYVGEEESVPGSGISVPSVSAVMPSDQENEWDKLAALVESCGNKHESWIASAYAGQPSSLESEARVWTGQEMRDCLTDHGFTIDDAATAAEIKEMWDADITANIDDTGFHPC